MQCDQSIFPICIKCKFHTSGNFLVVDTSSRGDDNKSDQQSLSFFVFLSIAAGCCLNSLAASYLFSGERASFINYFGHISRTTWINQSGPSEKRNLVGPKISTYQITVMQEWTSSSKWRWQEDFALSSFHLCISNYLNIQVLAVIQACVSVPRHHHFWVEASE